MFREFLSVVALPILFLLVAVVGVVDVMGRHTCSNFQEITGKQTKWVFFDTCYINHNQEWFRYDEYKARAIASEGLKSGK